MTQIVAYGLWLYEADGETPLLGYDEDEATFQTPDPSLPHDRPFLSLPYNATGGEVNFIEGSARTGSVQVRILDTRVDPADQTTGVLTSILPDLVGRRAVLKRWNGAEWKIRDEGVVYSVTVDPDTVVGYILEVRDGHELERNQSLFFSNFVLYGRDGAQGPAVDYGITPGGEPMLRAVEPAESLVAGNISHFKRLNSATPGDGIYWGLVAGPKDYADPFNLAGLDQAVWAADGLLYFREFQVWWRPKDSYDEWTVLRNMPSAREALAVARPGSGHLLEDGVSFFFNGMASSLYLGSTNSADIPADGQEIEFLVLAMRITEKTRFWWDEGTVGTLLQQIAAGQHTEEPPAERYNAAALAAFAASSPPARLDLREQPTDRRAWMAESVYKAGLVAPVFGEDREIVPRKWELPDPTVAVPLLELVQPVGEWSLPIAEQIREIEFRYIREHLDPRKTKIVKDSPPWWTFGFGSTREVTVDDPADTRRDWERLVRTEVVITNQNPDAPLGGKRLVYAPLTIRSIASVDGMPEGGDTRSELGHQRAELTFETLLFHNGEARPRMQVEAVATEANLARLVGDLVRARLPWLPDITERLRALRQIVRIVRIVPMDDPSLLRFTLEYTGVPDISAEDDETGTGTGGEDCLDGGARYPAAGGLVIRSFRTAGRFEIENTCDHEVIGDLVVIAGGGGGGDTGSGGGGGAGGVRIVSNRKIGAGQTITVDVGAGGDPGDPGEDSIWWGDVDGIALDPDTADPDDGVRAVGGGDGGSGSNNGNDGGSGGGGGAELPISGGSTSLGGSGEVGQGNDGGGGEDSGGIATCQQAAGGGGGSYGGAGTAPVGVGVVDVPDPGEGGPATALPGWGITAGGGGDGGLHTKPGASGPGVCGPEYILPGPAGAAGAGAGGGGAANGSGESGGSAGVVAFRYSGGLAHLRPPTISSVAIDDRGRAEICIDAADWDPGLLTDYKVRIEYAVAAVEPDASSSEWRYVGMLDAPGCVFTPPLPTGAKVWARGRAQAKAFKPSEFSAAVDADAPATPGFKRVELFVTAQGVATLAWEPLATTGAVRIRAKIGHNEGESTARPLTLIASLDASASPYTFASSVPRGTFATVDLEAWEDNTYTVQGRIERRSEENAAPVVVQPSDGIGALDDVEITTGAPGMILQFDDYGVLVDRHLSVALPESDLLDGDPDHFLNGEGDFVPLPNSSGWSEIIAATDQDVTNNSTLQNDAELVFAVGSGEVYDIELLLVLSGSDTSVDAKTKWTFPSSDGFIANENKGTSGLASQGFQVFGPTATTHPSEIAIGTEATHSLVSAWQRLRLSTKASGDVQFQFANNSAALGRVTRRKAGSVLRYRRLI